MPDNNEPSLDVRTAATRLGVCKSNVRRMIDAGLLKTATKESGRWRISAREVSHLTCHRQEFLSVPAAAAELGLHVNTVLKLASRGVFKSACRNPFSASRKRERFCIHRNEVEAHKRLRAAEAAVRERRAELRLEQRFKIPEGFVSSSHARYVLGVSRERIRQLCVSGKLPGARQPRGRQWVIPEEVVSDRAVQTRNCSKEVQEHEQRR